MGDFIVFDGARRRTVLQPTTPRKSMQTSDFYGNQHTSRRLVAAIQSSSNLTEAARRLGGADVFLHALKNYTDRRAA
jgi:hypothetical protein